MNTEYEKLLSYYRSVNKFNEMTGQEGDVSLAIKLIQEKVQETFDAIDKEDEKEIVGGICDVLVTCYGLVRQSPKLESEIKYAADYPISSEYSLILMWVANSLDIGEYSKFVYWTQMLFIEASKNKSWNMHENMLRVLDSNLAKFPTDESVAKESVLSHEANGVECFYEEVQGAYRIVRKSDGKILKPVGWKSPEIIIG